MLAGMSMDSWLQWAREVRRRPLARLESRLLQLVVRTLVLFCGPWIEAGDRRRMRELPEPAIFAFNHNNTFECLAVPAALVFERNGRLIHFLVDWMYTEIPFVGRALKKAGSVPIFQKPARWRLRESFRRQAQATAAPLGQALACLRSGGSLGIFPEGKRNRSATTLLRGRQGLGLLILLSEVPVIPVGIDFPARTRLGRVPRLGRIRLRIGEPLTFDREREAFRRKLAAPQDPGDLKRHSQRQARQLVDAVMLELARLSRKRYPYGTSPEAAEDAVQPLAHPIAQSIAQSTTGSKIASAIGPAIGR